MNIIEGGDAGDATMDLKQSGSNTQWLSIRDERDPGQSEMQPSYQQSDPGSVTGVDNEDYRTDSDATGSCTRRLPLPLVNRRLRQKN